MNFTRIPHISIFKEKEQNGLSHYSGSREFEPSISQKAMNQIRQWFLACSIILLSLLCVGCSRKAIPSGQFGLPVLPGAKGFGLATKGGRGGNLLKVNNLNNAGPGSLAEAIQATGPRISVFEVAGVINLNRDSLLIKNPYLTIAGQTAPFPGITIIQGGLKIQTHDIIIQHVKIRPGEAGQKKNSGWEIDGLTTAEGAFNVIVDHCSFTWATDENLSASGPHFNGKNPKNWRKKTSHKIVFSNCIIAEGLSSSTHSKGDHSKGTLIHDNATEILIIGNLFANNSQRNPQIKGGTSVVIMNNYIFNPGTLIMQYNLDSLQWAGHIPVKGKLHIEGNVIEFGPDTKKNISAINFHGPADVFWKNNLITPKKNGNDLTGTYSLLTTSPFRLHGLVPLPVQEVKSSVLQNAGAFPWQRDEIDKRIISQVQSGKGRIINSEIDAGGYPAYKPVYQPFNPDEWDLNFMTKKAMLPFN